MQKMKRNRSTFASNKFYFRFFRILFLILALTLFFAAAIGLIAPELVVINGDSVSMTGVFILLVLGVIALLIHLLTRNKFVFVVMDSNSLLIINPETKGRFTWSEVRIRQIPFVFPPLYSISLPSGSTYWFNTENKFASMSLGPVLDLSDMGRLIKQKNR